MVTLSACAYSLSLNLSAFLPVILRNQISVAAFYRAVYAFAVHGDKCRTFRHAFHVAYCGALRG